MDDDQFWNNKKSSGESSGPHPDAEKNAIAAKAFKQKRKWLEGMGLNLASSSGIRDMLVYITWHPNNEEKSGNYCDPISTHQSHFTFMQQMENGYNNLFRLANESLEKKRFKQKDFQLASNE